MGGERGSRWRGTRGANGAREGGWWRGVG
jgi:hypothetical protein